MIELKIKTVKAPPNGGQLSLEAVIEAQVVNSGDYAAVFQDWCWDLPFRDVEADQPQL